jgi:hypothetical protein
MKQQYRTINFQKKNLDLLQKIVGILKEYETQGIKVTLRQLYYQLVSRDIIPNEVKEYSKLSKLLTNARYSGIIDWEAIEDRVRIPDTPSIFENIEDLIRTAIFSYKLDKWKGQDYYVELWTEKDALSSIISPLTKRYQITFCVNRGYTSASAIHDSFERILGEKTRKGIKTNKIIILYLGDHDPSGLDMIRDIQERLDEIAILESSDIDIEVIPIALTDEQIKQYNPPPNPTKMTDSRAKQYIQNYGKTCWEVDALRPEILIKLIEDSILQFLDKKKFEKIQEQEEKDKEQIIELTKKGEGENGNS